MPRFTRERKDQFLGALKVGATIEMAAAATHVSRRTVYNHIHRNARFAEDVHDARILADSVLIREAYLRAKTDQKAFEFWITNRWPAEWSRRERLDGHVQHDHVTYSASIGDDGQVQHEEQPGEGKPN